MASAPEDTHIPDAPEIRTTQDELNPTGEGISRKLAHKFANSLTTHGKGCKSPSQAAANQPSNSASVQKDWALLKDPAIHNERLDAIRQKKGYIIDMDGVIYHVSRTLVNLLPRQLIPNQGTKLLPGAKELVEFLTRNNKKFLFLTNNSAPTPRELQQKLSRLGIEVTEDHFFTAGQATAYFLSSQSPKASNNRSRA